VDPELQKQLAELLRALLANAQDAATWAKAEIPLLVQEKIAFGRAWETTGLVLFLVGVGGLALAWRKWNAHQFDDDDDKVGVAVALTFASIVMGTFTGSQLHDTLLVWFAPRLYILEWLIGMVKKQSV